MTPTNWNDGKTAWTESTSWAATRGPGSTRAGEYDYPEEGKRRKYNEMSNNFEHDAGPPSEAASLSRQRDFTQEYAQDNRPQRPLAKKRLLPSEPSPHVIFLGLDAEFTEADLQALLLSNGCSIETVTIIRDRSTGLSKGFGFAQFTTIEHARAFVDPRFPFIQVPPPASHGASATAAFYKALETGLPHKGRRVKIDYSQSANPHDKGRSNRQNMNDGTRDIGNAQVPVLLFRGLDPMSGLQAIAQALHLSSGPGKDGANGMKRIILIKDKVTMVSLGFAFVEFVDVQSASAVLATTMSSQVHPAGFRISDRPVAASFAHAYSFQPVTDPFLRDEACIPSSMGLGGLDCSWVRYWDESSTTAVSEYEVKAQTYAPTQMAKSRKDKQKAKDSDAEHHARTTQVEASVLPKTDTPVTINLQRVSVSKHSTKVSAPASSGALSLFSPTNESGTLHFLNDEASEFQDKTGDKASVAGKKHVAPLIASKKTVDNINKWNQIQDERNDTVEDHSVPGPISGSPALSSIGEIAPSDSACTSTTQLNSEVEFEFSDPHAMTCLLCARQFRGIDQLRRHNRESELHKINSKDHRLRDVARLKANSSKKAPGRSEQPKYRDRAFERRIMHNQPEAPLAMEQGNAQRKRFADGQSVSQQSVLPAQPSASSPQLIPPGDDEMYIGNKLLKKMGWKEGTGLGLDGEGRTDPLTTAMYAQGAGIGASKGREIGKYTEGYSGYVHMAQEAARERYGN